MRDFADSKHPTLMNITSLVLLTSPVTSLLGPQKPPEETSEA